jgi:hypothetical protein
MIYLNVKNEKSMKSKKKMSKKMKNNYDASENP